MSTATGPDFPVGVAQLTQVSLNCGPSPGSRRGSVSVRPGAALDAAPPPWHGGHVPNRSSKPHRPRDPNQRAKLIVDLATGEVEDTDPDEGKNPAAVVLGRAGGLKGGKARAANMTAEERRKAARHAARVRWDKKAAD